MNFRIKKLSLISMIALAACNPNPYPESGGEIVNTPEPTRRTVAPAYVIDIKSTLKFREGMESFHKIKYHVPSGEPQLSFTGLPDGMIFDDQEKKLVWTPGYDAANDPSDVTVKVKRIPITIWLRSSASTNTAIKKEVVLEVHDTPREFKTDMDSRNSSFTVDEGDTFNRVISITNEDYPNGPFFVVTKNLPNQLIAEISNNEMTLNFSPDYKFVGVSDTCSFSRCYKKYSSGEIVISGPDGRQITQKLDLRINDTRQTPPLLVPDEINQGTDVNFVVSSYDPNDEISPKIELITSPKEGKVEFVKIQDGGDDLKQTHMRLTWSNIPISMRGKSARFRFTTCVNDSRSRFTNCNSKNVQVKINELTYLAPVVERDSWPLAHIEYLGFGSSKVFDLNIKDGNDPREDIHNIEILPENMKKMVSYRNGKLIVESSNPGVHQFKVVATSIYGLQTSESFTFEVFPKNRSRILSLVNMKRSKEVIENKKLFGNLDFANPDFQVLDRRIFSERDTLIIGTDILSNKEQLEAVEKASQKLENIIIMSPSIDGLKHGLLTEINELGIAFRGRFNSVVQRNLGDYYFLTGKDADLDYPRRRVKLNGNLTSESSNPVLLSKKISSDCMSTLSLSDDVTELDHLIGVKCQRRNGGYLLINGFEFGDMKAFAEDSGIPKSWLTKLMERM